MPTPIADLEAAKAAAQERAVLKDQIVNVDDNLQQVDVLFQYPSDPSLALLFQADATPLSPEAVAYDAIKAAIVTYCTDRVAELDAELVSYGVIL